MKKEFLKNLEWKVLIYSLILFIIGLFALYSATHKKGLEEFTKQIQWFIIAMPILLVFTFVDYKKIAKYSLIYYISAILLLIGVLETTAIGGATSWFKFGNVTIQPSEIMKYFIIISISTLIVKMQLKGKKEINKIHKLFAVLIVSVIPILLIIRQPDYGTALSYVFALVGILFVSGINKKYILMGTILFSLFVYLIYVYILPVYAPHALQRFNVYLNPELDPRGAGYNVIQSKLAVGSGGMLGMGFMNGTQTQLGFLHPKTTDFIFALISEEFGFVVSTFVVLVYMSMILSGLKIAKTARDNLGTYVATGITVVFFYHMIENIGMTTGLLPVTGIPLPFVSYGGSSLISNFIAIGLLLNISGRRQKAIFVDIRKNEVMAIDSEEKKRRIR